MIVESLLNKLEQRGIKFTPLPNGNLYVTPKSALTSELRDHIRAAKPELIAIATIRRLRAYVLADGRHVEIVRYIAEAIRGQHDPVQIRDNLVDLEHQLISMGARYDAELGEAISTVSCVFSSARLFGIRNLN